MDEAREDGLVRRIEEVVTESREDTGRTLEALLSQVDDIFKRLSRVERDLARGERDRSSILSELSDLKLLLAELRDLVRLEAQHTADALPKAAVEAAAAGGAQGASSSLAAPIEKYIGLIYGLGILVVLGFFMELVANSEKLLNLFLSFFGVTGGKPGE